MSELRLEQIVVSGTSECDYLYGLDEQGTVWTMTVDGKVQKWRKMSMTKEDEAKP